MRQRVLVLLLAVALLGAGLWSAAHLPIDAVPDLTGGGVGGFCVPNAQHAVRQGKVLAKNLTAALRGEAPQQYVHKNLGAVAGLGVGVGVFQSGRFAFKGLIAWFMMYTFSFLWIASFFGEGDATWHQTVIRDTALTPSHIVVFYACVPMYIVFGVSSLLYATTRIPAFARGYSLPLIMAVLGPGLILPNLGFNEWGHAFWMTEEIFSHPLHWGFPILGWTGLALGGLFIQVIGRMAELFKEVGGTADNANPA